MIILDCYTYRKEVYDFAKPSKSIDFIPQWWKNLPTSKCPVSGLLHESKTTMKTCPGFTELFKSTVTLPLWSDLRLDITDEGYRYQFSDFKSELSHHNAEQFDGMVNNSEWQHIKLHSPWLFFSNKPMKWAYLPPTWHNQEVKFLSAIDEYYYQHSTTINTFMRRGTSPTLEFGTPLVHLTPLSEEKLKLRCHLITREEYNSKQADLTTLTFTKWYYNKKRLYKLRKQS